MKEHDIKMMEMFNFKLLEAPVFLPGVNPDTKEADGSVRYYGDWELTIPATDSTEAKSGVLSVYHSFDFDENGKIVYEQMYGDFTGLMMYFQTPSEPMTEEASE